MILLGKILAALAVIYYAVGAVTGRIGCLLRSALLALLAIAFAAIVA